jgi:protocatechuate 3,4-dioxygenase beta subunit
MKLNAASLMNKHIVICVLSAVSVWSASTAPITGTVVDDSGNPVAGAAVIYHGFVPMTLSTKNNHPVPAGTAIGGSVTANSAGQFTTPALAPGPYSLCVYAPDPHLISNCDWATSQPPVTIGPTAIDTQITLRRGVVIHVATSDPNGRLVDNARYYLSAMTKTGAYATAQKDPTVANAGSGTALAVTVPKSTDVYLFLDTELTVINSATGATVLPGTAGLLVAASSASDLQVSLAIQ